jgi:hypothetical protein
MPSALRHLAWLIVTAPALCLAQGVTHGSCVAATTRDLAMFVGEYDVRAAFRAGPTAWDSSAARSTFRAELGGCLVRENFAGLRYGEPYAYTALWGTSGTAPHTIQRVFVHSQHGLLVLSAGAWNATGDSLVVDDSSFVRGAWVRERSVLSRPGPDGFTAVNWRSEDGGKSWFPTFRARYVRRRSGVR